MPADRTLSGYSAFARHRRPARSFRQLSLRSLASRDTRTRRPRSRYTLDTSIDSDANRARAVLPNFEVTQCTTVVYKKKAV